MILLFQTSKFSCSIANQPWPSRDRLRHFAPTIHDKGAPLENCWGLIDGTVRPLCKPDENQRILYTGHKWVHGIKFQYVVGPNRLIASLFGPVEARTHDSGMLVDLGLLQELSHYSLAPDETPLCVYMQVHAYSPVAFSKRLMPNH